MGVKHVFCVCVKMVLTSSTTETKQSLYTLLHMFQEDNKQYIGVGSRDSTWISIAIFGDSSFKPLIDKSNEMTKVFPIMR